MKFTRRVLLRSGSTAAIAGLGAGLRIPAEALMSVAQSNPDLESLFKKEPRQPLPTSDALSHATSTIRDLYETKSGSELLDLSEKEPDPAGKYALLAEARDRSLKGGDYTSGWKAAERLYNAFELPLSRAIPAKLPARVSRDQLEDRTRYHLSLAHLALGENEHALALKAAKDAQKWARSVREDKSFYERAKALVTHIPDLNKEYVLAKPPESVRKLAGGDAKVAGAVGKYLCFVKGTWDEGLPILLKSDDPKLRMLARMESPAPTEAQAQFDLGNRWLSGAKTLRKGSLDRHRFMTRARFWFTTAAPQAQSPLLKDRIAKTLGSLDPAPGAGPQPAAYPVRVSGTGFTIETLDEKARAFGNRNYVWSSIPKALRGWQFTRRQGGLRSDITIAAARTTYVYIATGPATAEGSVDLTGWTGVPGWSFQYDDRYKTEVTVHRRLLPAGKTLSIPEGNWTGGILLAPRLESVSR